MPCLCALQLGELSAALAAIPLELSLPVTEGEVNAAVEAAASFSGEVTVDLPLLERLAEVMQMELGPPGLSLSVAASLQAAIELAASLEANFGIDISAPGAEAALGEFAATVSANLSALGGAGGMDVSLPLELMSLAASVEAAESALGVSLTAPGASAAVSAEIAASAEASLSAELPEMPAWMLQLEAMVGPELATEANIEATLALAVAWAASANVSAALELAGGEAGAAGFEATLEAMANLEVPTLGMGLPELANLLGLVSAVATVDRVFGINLTMPGAAAELQAQLELVAEAVLNLELPAIEPPEISPLSLLAQKVLDHRAELNQDFTAEVSAEVAAAAELTLPDMSGFALLGALSATLEAHFGMELVAEGGCGEECPLAAAADSQ